MGHFKLSLFILVLSAIIGYIIYKSYDVPEIPKLTVQYWGPGKEKPDDKTIKPFKISFPHSQLKELREKLDKTGQFAPPLEGVGFEYGFNTNYLNEIINFWKKNYNWTEREEYFNSLPQFTTEIGGLKIHFSHIKIDPKTAKGKKVIPLIMIHGWPSGIREFYNIVPMLSTPRPDFDFVFELVLPSLPGYTFSQGSSKPGLSPAHIGVLLDELMNRLGYQEYYIHGGDWGSVIGLLMTVLYPNKILGFHSTFCIAGTPQAKWRQLIAYMFPNFFVEKSMQEWYIKQFTDTYFLESGYFHIQSTKPDTIGIALSDSPIGLAAYMLEKFSTWTNRDWRSLPDGGIERMNKVELIDNVMLYWLTKSITTSMRLYSEKYNKEYFNSGIDDHKGTVPTACAWFKYELLYNPPFVLNSAHENIVQISHFSKGGHFAANEEPKLLSEDIWKFIKTLREKKTEKN